MMEEAAPTPVPIHDILPPVGYLPVPLWMILVGGLVVLGLIGWAVWFFAFRKRAPRVTTATERAMRRLAGLRSSLAGADAYPFSIEVSEVLRGFIEESRGLAATRQTTREFLDAVRGRASFSEAEVDQLERFLELADMIKFARMSAGPDDCGQLLDSAEQLIRNANAPAPEVVK